MKRILSAICALSFALTSLAQGPEDALLFSENTFVGTARTLGMGNAFVALGGDLGAISINPAASAVFRHSEIAITPGLNIADNTATIDGVSSRDNFTSFKLYNLGFVSSTDTYRTRGLVNFNFGLAVNKIADFNKLSSASWRTSTSSYTAAIASSLDGVDVSELEYTTEHNPFLTSHPWPSILANMAWLVYPYPEDVTDKYIASTQNDVDGRYVIGGPLEQTFFDKSYGGIMEYAINLGFNFSDIFYLGCNLNLHSVEYTQSSYYSESSLDPSAFDDNFVSMSQDYYRSTVGMGVNFKIGAIVTPIAGLRIGATFTTPTRYNLTDIWNYHIHSSFSNGNTYDKYSPDGNSRYRVIAPIRWSLGVAYTFEELALVSVDWEATDYSQLSMSNSVGNKAYFIEDNYRISKGFLLASILRAGVEARPTDRWFVRAGYNWYTTPGNLVDKSGVPTYSYPDKHFASCGVGYRFGSSRALSLDFAYQRMLNVREQLSVYGGAPSVDMKNSANRLALTLAYRF